MDKFINYSPLGYVKRNRWDGNNTTIIEWNRSTNTYFEVYENNIDVVFAYSKFLYGEDILYYSHAEFSEHVNLFYKKIVKIEPNSRTVILNLQKSIQSILSDLSILTFEQSKTSKHKINKIVSGTYKDKSYTFLEMEIYCCIVNVFIPTSSFLKFKLKVD